MFWVTDCSPGCFHDLRVGIVVGTLESKVNVYNIHAETGLSLYNKIAFGSCKMLWKIYLTQFAVKSWQIALSPSGNEILAGTQTLALYDLSNGEKLKDLSKVGSQLTPFIHSVAFVCFGTND